MRMRAIVCGSAAALLLAGCSGTTALEDDAPATTPPPVTSATDPRVGELQVVVGELLDRIEVMNARIARLESGSAAQSVATVSEPAAEPEPVRPAPTQAAAPPKPAAASPSPRPVARARNLGGAAIAEAYRSALEMYGKGRLDDARVGFQAVFDADPNGDLADNALYWIGETYFSVAKYNDALRAYNRILTDYSDQNKAPDAELKIGLVHAKLGDLALARRTFETLMARYPYSTAAAAAKYELNKIKY